MLNWATVFCFTLLHSIWQSGLLYVIYILSVKFSSNPTPLSKRNVLYGLISFQWILSILTFCLLSINFQSTLFSGLLSIPHIAFPLDKIIIAAYALVVLMRLSQFFIGSKLQKRFAISDEKVPAKIRLFAELKALELGIKRKISIAFAKNISGPLTYGFIKPVILFPIGYLNQLNSKEAEMILLHELTHIRFNDYFLNLYLVLSEVFYFFNPFVRMMGNEIRMEREKNCDAWVLQFKYNSLEYAEALFKTAFLSKKFKLELGAISGKKELLNRIQSFPYFSNYSTQRSFKFFVYAGVLVLILISTTLLERPIVPAKQASPSLVKMASPMFVEQFEAVENIEQTEISKTQTVEANIPIQLESLPVSKKAEETESIVEDEMPLSFVSNSELPTKEVTLTETNSETGEVVVQHYKFVFYNNEWIVVPNWEMVSEPVLNDTLPTIPKAFSPIQ